jgi:hypothetical protein
MDEIERKYENTREWTRGTTDFFTITTTCILLESVRV